jgi:hypothetical protein
MPKRGAVLAFAVLLLSACATTSPTVEVEADPSVDVAAYGTYGWLPRPPQRGPNPVVISRVKAAMDRRLAAQGYAQSAEPDFLVAFTLGASERLDEGIPGSSVLRTRHGPIILDPGSNQRAVTDGTLTIYLFDARTRHPVWRAVATQELSPRGAEPAIIDAVVDGALTRLPARR